MNTTHYAVIAELASNINARAAHASADEIPALIAEIDQLLRRSLYIDVNAALFGLRDRLTAGLAHADVGNAHMSTIVDILPANARPDVGKGVTTVTLPANARHERLLMLTPMGVIPENERPDVGNNCSCSAKRPARTPGTMLTLEGNWVNMFSAIKPNAPPNGQRR